ncbi:MAG: TonB-dependent receptor [Bacteroidales bacterium]|nr:TonB-dependent receptor [Bacteroidales bacterium]
MNKKINFSLFFLLANFLCFGQTIKILDNFDLQPIENVAIFNTSHSKSTITDIEGRASFEEFNNFDTIIFQHPSYYRKTATYNKIKLSGFKIKLKEKPIYLSEVVISANRWEENKKEVPNKIVTISAKEIKFNNPQTTADLLESSNQVFVQKSQLGGGSPMIRGFATNSVLLVIDGVRMNNAIYRSGNLQNVISLDANIIENAEIIFGPGSVIYGSDALGGVMDFHTQKVKLSNKKTFLSAKAFSRYSSANNEKTIHFDINYSRKKIGALTSFTFSDFDDLKMGTHNNQDYVRKQFVKRVNGKDSVFLNNNKNIQKFSGYNQKNFMQKIRYKPNKYFDITYAFHYSNTSDIPRYDRLIQYKNDELKYSQWYYGPQKWIMNNFKMSSTDTTKFYDRAKLTIAQQYTEESRNDRKFQNDYLRTRTEKVDIFTINIDFDKKINKKSILFYGFENVYNNVDSKGITKNILTGDTEKSASRYPDGGNKYYSFASYINFKSNLSSKFTFISGLRYNYVGLYSKFDDKTFYDFPYDNIKINNNSINGSLGLVFRPKNNSQININASTGFRAPNLDDVGKIFDSEPGNVIVPNKNLKPEYVYNFDCEIIKKIKNNTKISISGFYSYLNDAMVRQNFTFNGQDSIIYDGEMSKVQALVNANYANIFGASFSFFTEVCNNLSFNTSLTYTHGEDNNNSPLRHVSPLFGSTSLTYYWNKIKFKIYSNYNGAIKNKYLAASEQAKEYMYAKDKNGLPYSPGWWTLNLKTSSQINKNFQLNFGVENILDNRYRPYSSGICAHGRNFIISLRYNFIK